MPAAPAAGTPAPATPDAKEPDARTKALIALLQAAGLLSKLVPSADKIRASELAKDYWPSRAVEDELRMIRLAEEEDQASSGAALPSPSQAEVGTMLWLRRKRLCGSKRFFSATSRSYVSGP